MGFSMAEQDSINGIVNGLKDKKKKKNFKGKNDADWSHVIKNRQQKSDSKNPRKEKDDEGGYQGTDDDVQNYFSSGGDSWAGFQKALESAVLKGQKDFEYDKKVFSTESANAKSKSLLSGGGGKDDSGKGDEKKDDGKSEEKSEEKKSDPPKK